MQIVNVSRFTKKRLQDNTHIYMPIVLHENNYWYCEAVRVKSINEITPEKIKIKRVVPQNFYKPNNLTPLTN